MPPERSPACLNFCTQNLPSLVLKLECIRYNVYMIQITAYLRTEEDLKKWKGIDNKAQFIHDALQGIPYKVQGISAPEQVKPIKTPEQAEKVIKSIPKDKEWSGPIAKGFSARRKK